MTRKWQKIFSALKHIITEPYNVPQKLDTKLQNYHDGDIMKIANISLSGGNRKWQKGILTAQNTRAEL